MASPARRINPDVLAGLLLGAAAAAGIVFENIGALRPYYDQFLTSTMTVAIQEAAIQKPLLLWINDGLMAIFFLFVGLEIKKEIMAGALSSWQKAALPVYGAIGGITLPALIFIGIVGIDAAEARGWAIPAATDIAFALGVLTLFGSRIAPELRIFLLAVAIVDDLAAIVIIALFYTAELGLTALGLAGVMLAILTAMNLSGVKAKAPYVLIGVVLWVCVLKSGVHATLAGVALGFAIPLENNKEGRSPLITMKYGLSPWVAFLVMPVFAFANAGVPLEGLSVAQLTEPLTLGIAAGLFLGKQIGVFGLAWTAIKLKLAEPPKGGTMMQLYGVSMLAGIGFTMSLFIGTLAFADPEHQNAVRLGVLTGSLLSGIIGATVLALSTRGETAEVPATAHGAQPRAAE